MLYMIRKVGQEGEGFLIYFASISRWPECVTSHWILLFQWKCPLLRLHILLYLCNSWPAAHSRFDHLIFLSYIHLHKNLKKVTEYCLSIVGINQYCPTSTKNEWHSLSPIKINCSFSVSGSHAICYNKGLQMFLKE